MTTKENLPEEIKKPDEDRGGVPMKINYNKRSPLLQGPSDLVEEDGGTVQMMKGIDTEDEIDGTVFAGKRVGRTDFKCDLFLQAIFLGILPGKVDHHPGEVDSLESKSRKGLR